MRASPCRALLRPGQAGPGVKASDSGDRLSGWRCRVRPRAICMLHLQAVAYSGAAWPPAGMLLTSEWWASETAVSSQCLLWHACSMRRLQQLLLCSTPLTAGTLICILTCMHACMLHSTHFVRAGSTKADNCTGSAGLGMPACSRAQSCRCLR